MWTQTGIGPKLSKFDATNAECCSHMTILQHGCRPQQNMRFRERKGKKPKEKQPSDRGAMWSLEDMEMFLDFWDEEEFQCQLDGSSEQLR